MAITLPPRCLPTVGGAFFVFDKTAVSSMSDDEIAAALSLLSAEAARRERSRFEKARL